MEWPALASPWVPIFVAFIPVVAAALFKMLGYWRSDAKDDDKRRRERDEAEAEAEFKQRALLSADQSAWFDRVERERDDLRKRCTAMEAEAADAWKHVRRLEAELYARGQPPKQPPFQM